jgi:hypothetical protein
LLFFLLFFHTANAQIFSIGDDVKQAFDKQYPAAKEVDWNGGLDQHTVTFKLNDQKFKASYTKTGFWNWTETKITFDSLPKAVQEGFQTSKYKAWTVKDCIQVEKPRSNANEYKVIAQKSALSKKILVFDAKGRLYEELISL